MADATLVDVLDAGHQLLVHAHRRFLVKPLMRHDIVKELTILAKFHDEEELAFRFNDFIELDHIWMPDFLEDFDLSAYSLDVLLVFDS